MDIDGVRLSLSQATLTLVVGRRRRRRRRHCERLEDRILLLSVSRNNPTWEGSMSKEFWYPDSRAFVSTLRSRRRVVNGLEALL